EVGRTPEQVDRREIRPDGDAAGEGTGGVARGGGNGGGGGTHAAGCSLRASSRRRGVGAISRRSARDRSSSTRSAVGKNGSAATRPSSSEIAARTRPPDSPTRTGPRSGLVESSMA